MISIDGRLREKSNAKVAVNESRAADAEENEFTDLKNRRTIVCPNPPTLRRERARNSLAAVVIRNHSNARRNSPV